MFNYPKKPTSAPQWWQWVFISNVNTPSTWHISSFFLNCYAQATNLHKIPYVQVTDEQYSDTEYLFSLLTRDEFQSWRDTDRENSYYVAAIIFLLKIVTKNHTISFDLSQVMHFEVEHMVFLAAEYAHILRSAKMDHRPQIKYELESKYYASCERPIGIAFINKYTGKGQYLFGINATENSKILCIEYT